MNMHVRRPEADGKKKRTGIFILFGFLLICIAYVLHLCIHDPGIPINAWTPNDSFSVRDAEITVIPSEELQYLELSTYKNPETIRFYNGWLYAAVDGGRIIRLREDGSDLSQVLSTGGYILGFDFDANGILYFCDCEFAGAPAICRFDGDRVEKLPLRDLTYPDALCLSADGGTLYYTNASCVSPAAWSCSPQEAYTIDMMAHSDTGTVWSYDFRTQTQRLIADGFCFANGLQLTEDGKSLLVNETTDNQIWRIDLVNGEKKALLSVPGFPDNLHAADGGYWSGFAGSYAPAYAGLSNKPLLRRILLNLPRFVLRSDSGNTAEQDAVFIKYDADGNVLAYNTVENTGFTVTGVVETDSRIYLESISDVDRICYYEKPGQD